jgi:hypothetical protein
MERIDKHSFGANARQTTHKRTVENRISKGLSVYNDSIQSKIKHLLPALRARIFE